MADEGVPVGAGVGRKSPGPERREILVFEGRFSVVVGDSSRNSRFSEEDNILPMSFESNGKILP